MKLYFIQRITLTVPARMPHHARPRTPRNHLSSPRAIEPPPIQSPIHLAVDPPRSAYLVPSICDPLAPVGHPCAVHVCPPHLVSVFSSSSQIKMPSMSSNVRAPAESGGRSPKAREEPGRLRLEEIKYFVLLHRKSFIRQHPDA